MTSHRSSIFSSRPKFHSRRSGGSDDPAGIVLCLTRDRPQTLIHALNAVSADLKKAKLYSRALIVLDDSVNAQSRLRNLQIAQHVAEASNCVCRYHGPAEQRNLMAFLAARCGFDQGIFNLFFRRLGGLRWDLGGVRTYAMILGNLVLKRPATIVMLDDDIVIRSHARSTSAISELEQAVLTNPLLLTGGVMKGSPDESSIETGIRLISHFSGFTDHPLPSKTAMPVSGGLLAFHNKASRLFPFPRWYNEDWTWLAQCRTRGYAIRASPRVVAEQIPAQKELRLVNLKREQEGELIFEALNWASEHYRPTYVPRALKSRVYWEDVAREEVIYLDRIINFVSGARIQLSPPKLKLLKRAVDIQLILQLLRRTRNHVASIKPDAMMSRYVQYVACARRWRTLAKAAQNCAAHFNLSGTRV